MWEDRFEATYGVLRDEVIATFDEYLNCGLLLTVLTAGEGLNFNPHLHGLLADGTINETEVFTPFSAIETERMAEHVRDRVFAAFVSRGLVTAEVPAQILSQAHSGFGAWVGEPFMEEDCTKFVARSIERGPLSLEKLSITDDIVSYTTSGGAAYEFDALEFLMLLSSHIPKPYESIICYYGYYSCRARGERRGYAPEGEAFSAQQLERAPSRASFSQLKPAKAQLTDVFNDGRRVIDFPNLR